MYHNETPSDQTELDFGEEKTEEIIPPAEPISEEAPTQPETQEEDEEFADGPWGELGYRKK